MDLSNLKPAVGAVKHGKRVGRGPGSGKGGTSTRGHKGAKSRSGYKRKVGFEGGQMPLTRKIPKRGFTNIFKKEYTIVNIGKLDELFEAGQVVDAQALVDAGLVSKSAPYGLKVLGSGELTKALTVKAARFSETAKAAIEKAGGVCQEVQ